MALPAAVQGQTRQEVVFFEKTAPLLVQQYCFYADEAKVRTVPNYGRMPEAVSHALIEKAAKAAEGSITFLLHAAYLASLAGPTVLPR